jgi:Tfp pilus assembly protein PilF
MLANEILKASKNPMNYEEAKGLENKIMSQKYYEQEANKMHRLAQDLRIEIQKAMNFNGDEYYQFLNANR